MKRIVLATIITALLLTAVLTACGKQNAEELLVGRWEIDEAKSSLDILEELDGSSACWEFRQDGTGYIRDADGEGRSIKWSVDDNCIETYYAENGEGFVRLLFTDLTKNGFRVTETRAWKGDEPDSLYEYQIWMKKVS